MSLLSKAIKIMEESGSSKETIERVKLNYMLDSEIKRTKRIQNKFKKTISDINESVRKFDANKVRP